jgi:hypothetical protein
MAAVTITLDGVIVNSADSATDWSSGSLDTDSEVQGTGCIGAKSSNALTVFGYAAPSGTREFDSPGAANWQETYTVWINCLTPNLDLKSNGGLRLIMGDGTNRASWFVGGDASEPDDPYRGGWKAFTVDPAIQFDSIDLGSPGWTLTGNPGQLNGINRYGGGISTTSTIMGNFNNALIDQMIVGRGLQLIGGDSPDSPGNFASFVAEDELTKANKYGYTRTTSGVIFTQGRLIIGSSTVGGGSPTVFESMGEVIIYEEAPITADTYSMVVQGDTVFTFGALSGGVTSDGVQVFSADGIQWDFIVNGVSPVVSVYGTTFRNMHTMSPTVGCTFQGDTFSTCGVIYQTGATFTDCVFTGFTETSALIMDSPLVISDCLFTNNTRAIRIDSVGTYEFDNLTFSGNTVDVWNATGTGTVTINVNGGDTPSTLTTVGGTTVVNNNKTHTLTGLALSTEVTYVQTSPSLSPLASPNGAIIFHVENVSPSPGTTAFGYNYATDLKVDILIMHLDYEPIRLPDVILGNSNASLPIQQVEDRVFSNP